MRTAVEYRILKSTSAWFSSVFSYLCFSSTLRKYSTSITLFVSRPTVLRHCGSLRRVKTVNGGIHTDKSNIKRGFDLMNCIQQTIRLPIQNASMCIIRIRTSFCEQTVPIVTTSRTHYQLNCITISFPKPSVLYFEIIEVFFCKTWYGNRATRIAPLPRIFILIAYQRWNKLSNHRNL